MSHEQLHHLKNAIANSKSWHAFGWTPKVYRAVYALENKGLLIVDREARRYRLATSAAQTSLEWMELNRELVERSKVICKDNHCSELDHNCESRAYFRRDAFTGAPRFVEVSSPDYVQDWRGLVELPLPISEGDYTGEELEATIAALLNDLDAEHGSESL